MKNIYYGRQTIDNDDLKVVLETLKSDFLTQGPTVKAFEYELAQITNSKHVVSLSNATAALHLGCLALNLGKDDWLWTSAISFVASANCALYCGAKVNFIDIDPITLNMDLDCLEVRLAEAAQSGSLPKVVVPVHFAGLPLDMSRLKLLSDKYGFKILEDASHALGASINGVPVGAGAFSDLTVFSFHPVKMITTGEGGSIHTNNDELATKLLKLRSHGITRNQAEFKNNTNDEWYYEQQLLGFNYRMCDIQAALGVSQLKKLKGFVDRRRDLAALYKSKLNQLSAIQFQHETPGAVSSFHLFVIRLVLEGAMECRRLLYQHLKERGIVCNVHYIPIPNQPYYKGLGYSFFETPNAQEYYNCALSLPIYPSLQQEDVERISAFIMQYFKEL